MEIFDWDATAGNNNAAPPNGWPEFMQYGEVNNSAREGMAVLKRFYAAAIGGTLVTSGTSTAYTLTSGQTFAAYANGQRFAFVAHATSTGAVTLNVDGKGAVAVVDARGNALGAGDLVQNGIYEVIKTATSFRIVNSLTSSSLQLQVGNTLRRAITTAGTATAYTVAGGGLFNPYEDGQILAFVPHVASGAAPTINIDSQGAEALQDSTGATIATGALRLGVPALAVRRSGAWRVIVDGVTITPYAKTLLDDADAATARATLVAPRLDGSNIFTPGLSNVDFEWLRLQPSDAGTGKPYIYIRKSSVAADYEIGIWDGSSNAGTLSLSSGALLHSGNTVHTTATAATQAEMEAASSNTVHVTPGRARFHPGAAKAWLVFAVSGGTPSISASHNVTSITDNGVGDYTINFTTAFASADYTISGSARDASAGQFALVSLASTGTKTASACRISTVRIGSGGAAAVDPAEVSVVFFGDQ